MDAAVTVRDKKKSNKNQVQQGRHSLLLRFAREVVNLLWAWVRVCAQMSLSACEPLWGGGSVAMLGWCHRPPADSKVGNRLSDLNRWIS